MTRDAMYLCDPGVLLKILKILAMERGFASCVPKMATNGLMIHTR
jgi:hypothetical protein